jgi:hypothetical protein
MVISDRTVTTLSPFVFARIVSVEASSDSVVESEEVE